MLNDADVLGTLSQLFSDSDRQVIVGRLLRVPEVWTALHTPEFLAKAAEQPDPASWLPGRLAALALGEKDLAALVERGVALNGDRDRHDSPAEANGIEEVTALAVHLLAKSNVELPDSDLAQAIDDNPALWTSPLACAWPDLMSTSWLEDYFPKHPDPGHARMLVNALLANLDLLGAAQSMVALNSTALAELLPLFQTCGYDSLYAALGQLSIEKIAGFESQTLQSPTSVWTAPAVLLAATGDTEGAHQAFRQAWDISSETSAEVADRLAAFARAEDDFVLEMEARRQALQVSPTPERRAALVRVLLGVGRGDEAARLIDSPTSPHAWIAAAAVQQSLGNYRQAALSLEQACALVLNDEPVNDDWLAWLLELLKARKDFTRAIDVQQLRSEMAGADPACMLELARLYEAAGDTSASACQADLALTLEPASVEARLLLAESLQSSNQPDKALVHWKKIHAQHPEYWPAVGRCALEAGEVKLARDTAASALSIEPESYNARVLLGEALTLEGDPAAGLTHLKQAVEMVPQEAQGWIALSEAQVELGDDVAAGEALQKGVQAVPASGRLHMAYARWLLKNEQPSMALEHTRTAIGLEPDQSNWRIEQAELLRELGRVEEALPELRTALSAQPENWRARKALGLTYEVMGEIHTAAKTLARLPEQMDAESKLLAGRILVKSICENGPGDLKTAMSLLVAARESGLDDSSIWYWLARAYEKAGLMPQAVEAYVAFLEPVGDIEHPLKLEALLGFARASAETEQLDKAIETLEKGRQAFPASHELLYNLSRAYLKAGQPAEAVRSAKQAVELVPGSIAAHETLRDAALANGKIEDAVTSQEAILKITPEDPESHIHMAQLCAKNQDTEQARAHLARAIWYSRSNGIQIASLAEEAGDIAGSELSQTLLKRASTLAPGHPEILTSLSRLSETLGDYETAQSSWLKLAATSRHDPYPLQRAADALSKLGRRAAALGLRQRALEISPEAPQHLALAKALQATGDSAASLEHYMQAAERAPDDAKTLLDAAMAVGELGDPEQARNLLERAGQLGDETERFAIVGAALALASGDAQGAATTLGKLPSNGNPNHYRASLEVQALRAQGQINEAQALFAEMLTSPIESYSDLSSIVNAALSLNAWTEAIDCVERGFEALDMDEGLVFLTRMLGHRYRDLEWLYRITGNAEMHAPNSEEERLLQLIKRSHAFPLDLNPADAALLELWDSLQSGSVGPNRLQQIQTLPRSQRRDLVEAGIISLLKSNRPARAIEFIKSTAEFIAGNPRIVLLSGISETMLGHYQTALEIVEEACYDALYQPLALYLQSVALRKAGEEEEYLTKLNGALSLWPDEHTWHFELAERYLGMDHLDAAIPHLQHAVELDPHNGDYLVVLARAYRTVGQLDDAESMFSRSLQFSPKSAHIWKEAGDVALATGNLDGAEKWFERACTLAPSDVGCMIQSARTALARGENKTALKRAQAAYRLEPEEPTVLSGFAEILAADGKIEKAIQMYDTALKTSEGDFEIKLARGILLAKSGRAVEAAQELKTIVDHTPDDDQAWAALARAQQEAGRLEQALDAANQALKISPRNVRHMQLVGVICREAGQLDRALSTLTEAAAHARNDAKLARELGKVYEDRREIHHALESFKRAIELDPQDADSLMRAGLILKNIKLYDQAGELFERSVLLNPIDPQALQQLATIRALQLIHGSSGEAEAVPTS